MSTNEPEAHAGTPTGDVAIVGDEARGGTRVSMQVIQDIYNEFTGKSEEISKGYSKAIQVGLADIEQLNSKVGQLQEQYNICSKNSSVTIYYAVDTREVFSSFERFRMYDASRVSPVESILLKYDFLIKLPQTNRLQSYTLSIRLASRISIMKNMRDEFPHDVPLPLLSLLGNRNAIVSINYIDYMVARNFQDGVKGWIDGLEEHSFHKAIKFLQRKSHYIPKFTKYFASGVVLYLILKYLPRFVPIGGIDLNQLARFLILAFASLFVAFNLAAWIGGLSEDAVDNLIELSYIRLNRGDEREIKIAKDKNRVYIIRAIGGIIATLLLGTLSSLIANYISK